MELDAAYASNNAGMKLTFPYRPNLNVLNQLMRPCVQLYRVLITAMAQRALGTHASENGRLRIGHRGYYSVLDTVELLQVSDTATLRQMGSRDTQARDTYVCFSNRSSKPWRSVSFMPTVAFSCKIAATCSTRSGFCIGATSACQNFRCWETMCYHPDRIGPTIVVHERFGLRDVRISGLEPPEDLHRVVEHVGQLHLGHRLPHFV